MPSEGPKNYKPVKLRRFTNATILHKFDFPVYYMECLSERHLIVVGGTERGLRSHINIFELVPFEDSCSANLLTSYLTPTQLPKVIMNGSVLEDQLNRTMHLATSGDLYPIVFKLAYDPNKRSFSVSSFEKLTRDNVKNELKAIKCIPGKVLSGSEDGDVIIWEFANKRISKTFHAHSKAIDEIDYHPASDQLATLSRQDGKCVIWKLSTLDKLKEINNAIVDVDGKFALQTCNYAYNLYTTGESRKEPSLLLVACNSVARGGFCKICIWNTNNLDDFRSIRIQVEGISSMAISQDSKYVGIGSKTGSVLIHNLSNGNSIYRIDNAHVGVVVSLKFLPSNQETLTLTNSKTCALLSVSLDKRLMIHRPIGSLTFSFLKKLILLSFIFILYLFITRHII